MLSTTSFVELAALFSLFTTSIAAPAKVEKRTARESTVEGKDLTANQVLQVAVLQFVAVGRSPESTALGTSSTAAACIFIYGGTYTEQIYINYKGALTIYGYTANTGNYKGNAVTITHSLTSATAGSLDASSTANIVSSSLRAYNINFANSYGAGAQTVAVTANGDLQGYYGCGFYGYQDVLYAKSGRQYYSNCYIQGADDYIFGDAAAWFGECTIASNGGGSITANSRSTSTDATWYVFDHSNIEAASGYTAIGQVYLGRPWRVLARVIYQNSALSNIINAQGWTTLAADATPTFEEYNNSGAGSSTSGRLYETTATAAVTKDTLWGTGWESWTDTTY